MNPELLEVLKDPKYKKPVSKGGLRMEPLKTTKGGKAREEVIKKRRGGKQAKTLVKEAAKKAAAEIYAGELEDIKKHAEEVVQRTIHAEIPDIVEKMAMQAKAGSFAQQKEFLRRVSPEPKAQDLDKLNTGFSVNINIGEFRREEESVVIDVTPKEQT